MKFKGIVTTLGLLAALSVEASVLPANTLLNNGGFEAPDVGDGSWEYYTSGHNGEDAVPGWSYDGSGMEIWDSLLGVVAPEGEQLAELNAHGANNIAYTFSQTFATIAGQAYNYGFAYRARSSNAESFFAGIVGIDATTLFDDHTTSAWSFINLSFVATGDSATLQFKSNDGVGDTTGNLLDAVYVTAVPEPASLALLGLGLIGLGFSRRAQKAA